MVYEFRVWNTNFVVIILSVTSIIIDSSSMWKGMAFSWTIAQRKSSVFTIRYPTTLLKTKNTIRMFASQSVEPDWNVARDIVEGAAAENKMCCAIAGGGSSAISTLASTPGASQLLLEGIVTYDRHSLSRYLSTCKAPLPPCKNSYVSPDTSQALSISAWHSSQALSSSRNWGLACTSALSSHSPTKKRSHSLGYISITNPQLECTTYQIKVSNSIPRHSQDIIFGNILLTLFHSQLTNTTTSTTTDDDDVLVECLDTHNFQSLLLQQGLEQVRNSQRSFLYLTSSEKKKWLPTSLPQTKHPILVPGSFNPIHSGHVQLAQAAASTVEDEDSIILFEISMTNADKPPISIQDVLSRLQSIQQLCGKEDNVGVVISDAPYFVQKVQLFHTNFHGTKPLSFVIGTDTMIRLLDPKYYHDSKEEMMTSLKEIQSKQVQFIVGGRLDQKKDKKKFITGQEEVSTLPSHLQSLFQLLPNFRVDMSSSDIRSKQQQKQQQE